MFIATLLLLIIVHSLQLLYFLIRVCVGHVLARAVRPNKSDFMSVFIEPNVPILHPHLAQDDPSL